ncbi:MAG: D-glycero-beta-D-manno-heptose 1-phosphate adenylyltransferase [Candidatus Omnitrophota bacterium]
MTSQNKIKNHEEAREITKKLKTLGKAIGFTNGCFDILHLGHIRYLREAKRKCDFLVVGVNSDSSLKRLNKGKNRPFNRQDDRIEVLSALECVDLVTLFEEDTPEDLIKLITPDLLFKGADWKEDEIVGSGYVKAKGGKVCVIPYMEGYSTTNLIERIVRS